MKSLRILIADDHDIVREGVCSMLRQKPHWTVCDEAANGKEAVEKALQLKPDLIIMDYAMPEMNGLDATRIIHQALPEAEILILTMHDSEWLIREVLAAGARGFLLKIDVRRNLFVALEALAAHKPFFDPNISSILLDRFLNPEVPVEVEPQPTNRLTARELEILKLLAEGKSTREAAAQLSLSSKTVDAHRTNIMNKLNLHSLGELVLFAVRNRIVQP